MTQPRIEVEGAKQLARAFRQVEGGLADLKAVHKDAAEIVATQARFEVPVRSGLLKSTIRSAGQARAGVVRAGFARVPYAGVIHFGWPRRNISPQPFLYDALDERTGEVLGKYKDNVDRLIRKHGLK